MIIARRLARKVLVLVSHPGAFKACKETFEKRGFEIVEDIEYLERVDFALCDSFFLAAGALEFLKNEHPVLPYIWISESFKASHELPDARFCYDRLHIPFFTFHEMTLRITSWLETAKAQFLFEQFPREFGSGLWMDVMMRMGANSEIASRQSA